MTFTSQGRRSPTPIYLLSQVANPQPTPTPRLSTVVDPSLFIAEKSASMDNDSVMLKRPARFDDLNSSPLYVEPYPSRPKSTADMVPMDTPARKNIEGVYDRYVGPLHILSSRRPTDPLSRFLMSTTGVKRNGKGYQSDNAGPIAHIAQPSATTKPLGKRSQKNIFGATKKHHMPPPVSSEDWRKSAVPDEFGALSTPSVNNATTTKGDKQGLVRRALRTIVNGKR